MSGLLAHVNSDAMDGGRRAREFSIALFNDYDDACIHVELGDYTIQDGSCEIIGLFHDNTKYLNLIGQSGSRQRIGLRAAERHAGLKNKVFPVDATMIFALSEQEIIMVATTDMSAVIYRIE